jgi:hypothetical protein
LLIRFDIFLFFFFWCLFASCWIKCCLMWPILGILGLLIYSKFWCLALKKLWDLNAFPLIKLKKIFLLLVLNNFLNRFIILALSKIWYILIGRSENWTIMGLVWEFWINFRKLILINILLSYFIMLLWIFSLIFLMFFLCLGILKCVKEVKILIFWLLLLLINCCRVKCIK